MKREQRWDHAEQKKKSLAGGAAEGAVLGMGGTWCATKDNEASEGGE